ncbi:hypothetical protein [Muricoccus radiodurans]|uniref:hypothetical protein n=1 Tax=Muricoccus radiodurans TaxID=2231721 RepID=UPI003CF2273D
MQGWPEPLRRQVQTLVTQFLRGTGEAWIGVTGIDCFGVGQRFPGTMRLGGRMEALGSRPPSRAFVWVQGTEPELWVDPRDSGYRDLFDEFARGWLNLSGRPTGTAWNIDHVFPKAAGRLNGLSHVRALAIGAEGNQAAGRTLERAMSDRAGDAPRRKRIRHATWMTIGKAAGFTGWESLPDSEDPVANAPVVAALFAHLVGLGITVPHAGLERSLTARTLTTHR